MKLTISKQFSTANVFLGFLTLKWEKKKEVCLSSYVFSITLEYQDCSVIKFKRVSVFDIPQTSVRYDYETQLYCLKKMQKGNLSWEIQWRWENCFWEVLFKIWIIIWIRHWKAVDSSKAKVGINDQIRGTATL